MTLKNFMADYDRLVNDWMKNPSKSNPALSRDPFMFMNLDFDGMPEPYFGDPGKGKCSAVIININPGQTIPTNDYKFRNRPGNIMYHYSLNPPKVNYSDLAIPFPYLDKGYKKVADTLLKAHKVKSNSCNWWQLRKNWIDRLLSNNDLNPFAIELCPWHSYKWNSAKFQKTLKSNSQLKTRIKDYLIEPACEAIDNSKLGFGLIIGKSVCDSITIADPSWHLDTVKQWNYNNWALSNGSWPLNKNGKPIKREYAVLTDGKHKFLCTWAPGANNAPSDAFHDVENYIIQQI